MLHVHAVQNVEFLTIVEEQVCKAGESVLSHRIL